MDSHGIEVLYGTDNDYIVFLVPHYLEFELLPSYDGFLDHNLVYETGVKSPRSPFFQVLGVVGRAASGPAKCKTRTYDNRITDLCGQVVRLFHVPDNTAPWHAEPDILHCITEKPPVFSLSYDLDRRPYHLHAKLVQGSHFSYAHSRVQTCLASECGQKGVRALCFDHHGDNLGCDRLYVRAVCGFRISHDCGGIAVDQDHLIAVFLEGLARLGPGVVKLARLSDNNRA